MCLKLWSHERNHERNHEDNSSEWHEDMRPSQWFAPWANGPWSDGEKGSKRASWASELENTKPSSQANVSNSGRPHKLRVDELPLARVKCSMHSKHYAVMQTDCAWVSGLDQFSSRLKDWSMCAITSSHHHNKTPNNIKRIYKTNIVPLDTTNHSIHQTTICKTNQHHP